MVGQWRRVLALCWQFPPPSFFFDKNLQVQQVYDRKNPTMGAS
jgi:hypothetical protein